MNFPACGEMNDMELAPTRGRNGFDGDEETG